MKATIHETITNQIVTAIEEGAGLYKMPWHRMRADITNPVNVISCRSYRGLNIISLWMIAEARQFQAGHGQPISSGRKAPVMPMLSDEERIEEAEHFFGEIPAEIEKGSVPCYMPQADIVQMVPFHHFESAKAYYSVLAHELTHWSGAKPRLDRNIFGRFGSESYAMEELVAELGAAFIAGQLGLPSEPRRDHAPHIASWLKVLKSDSRAIFTAASKAQAAADYLSGFAGERPT